MDHRRRSLLDQVREANQRNTPLSWDYQPFFDASKLYAR